MKSLREKRVNVLTLLGGVVNTCLGYQIATTPQWCDAHWPFCWDWSSYNIPLGIVVASIGLFMFIMAFRKGQRYYAEVFICPKCETALPFAEVPNEICPKCQTKLEPLEGFYERHPELKDK